MDGIRRLVEVARSMGLSVVSGVLSGPPAHSSFHYASSTAGLWQTLPPQRWTGYVGEPSWPLPEGVDPGAPW